MNNNFNGKTALIIGGSSGMGKATAKLLADNGAVVLIDTTRPELLPACVALVAHPDDSRYQPCFDGATVRTPLFGVEVEVRAHELADPEKGYSETMAPTVVENKNAFCCA